MKSTIHSLRIALIVLNYNDSDNTISFVNEHIHYNIIDYFVVVDNMSTDCSWENLQKLKKLNKVHLLRTELNGGYGYGNNRGIEYAIRKLNATHIIISNPDVFFSEDSVLSMVDVFCSDTKVAVVAPYMLSPDKIKDPSTAWKVPSKIQYIFSSGFLIGKVLPLFYYKNLDKEEGHLKEVGCVAGSFLMTKAEFMEKYGFYDEGMFLYCEETALGIKVRNAGYRTILLLDKTFIHVHGASIHKSLSSMVKRNKQHYKSKLYIMKHYYHFNKFEMLCARIVHKINLIESIIVDAIK